MSESHEGTAFLFGLIIAAVVAFAIPDAATPKQFEAANAVCTTFGGLDHFSSRGPGTSRNIRVTCNNGNVVHTKTTDVENP